MNPAVVEKRMRATWQETKVASPHLADPVDVVSAKDVPYVKDNNRLQNLNIYLPYTAEAKGILGTSQRPPKPSGGASRWLVYIHGGAWRDPLVLSNSIEPTVAQTFGPPQSSIHAIASINYSLSPHPTHDTQPYDPAKGDQNDAARECSHPRHVLDVVAALDFLRDVLGMSDDEYILAGHSCGATLALQATMLDPNVWPNKETFRVPPTPSAVLGLNGLYDLPLLVHKPSTHNHLRGVYDSFLRLAFGDKEDEWTAASPAQFDASAVAMRVKQGLAPGLVVLDQSQEDQLVPLNQTEAMEQQLQRVSKVSYTRGQRMTGRHNDAWESGVMIRDSVLQIAKMLANAGK
ncbi:MAG: hypothetical protein Q9162_007580 [Coniocarpon cinnabarinum]